MKKRLPALLLALMLQYTLPAPFIIPLYADMGDDAEYVICITLPLKTDFQNCTANITLADGASVSGDSPCLKADVGGRMVLDLTREPRDLIVENGSDNRCYSFEIALS